MKLTWGLIFKPNALWVQVLKAKYHCGDNLVPIVGPKHSNSLTWRGVCAVWKNTLASVHWVVRNGWVARF